jgi:hypothetical protein
VSREHGSAVAARELADEALSIASRHGYRQPIDQFQRIRDSIPSGKE